MNPPEPYQRETLPSWSSATVHIYKVWTSRCFVRQPPSQNFPMAEEVPEYTLHQNGPINMQNMDPEKASQTEEKLLQKSYITQATGAQFDDPNLDPVNLVGFDDESPYPEVRSAVANTDDFDMPVSTARTWIIGMVFAIILPGLNQFFYFRFPSVQISSLVGQLLSFPVGRAAAAFLPNWTIFGVRINPGPFTVKEHVLITIMATVGLGSAYATDVIAVQRVYYNQNYNFSYQWFIVMSTQLIGFSIGGVARRFLVIPSSMIWPVNLVNCALFNTLHSQQYAGIGNHGGISRERFFCYVLLGSFLWYFFPGYLFQGLSYFSWVTWIRPEDPTIAQLFGYVHGIGMSFFTFDWSQITYIGSPLATPWWAEANIFAGFVFFFWFLTPLLYFTNTWYAEYMPILSRTSFDNQQKTYDVQRILTPESTFDLEAYRNYSPLLLPTTFAISYGLSFASVTATLVHAFLYFRKQIWTQARRSIHEQPDIHARLMAKYPQVPEWWYLIVFLSMFTLGVISIEVWPTQMPVWAFVLALCIAFVYVIPIGMIQAITNQQVGLNVITELVIGFALPGHPLAMMMFKTWGYITMVQALIFASDFKLGHYMKVAPRAMFWSQIAATVVAGTVQLGVQAWMFTNIPDMCSSTQKDGFICPGTQVFGTASIVWGVIGPRLQFAKGQLYYPLVFFFLIGAIAPVITWVLSKRFPNSLFEYVKPVLLNGTGLIPPATSINYVPWALVGFIFQYLIRRHYFSWWTKYNYILSAGLDSGLAISILVIFFTLQFPNNGTIGLKIQHWWGNTVPFTGADGLGTPVRQLAPGATFGPSHW